MLIRFRFYSLRAMFHTALFSCLISSVIPVDAQQSKDVNDKKIDSKIFKVDGLSPDGKLSIREYTLDSYQIIDISDLDLTQDGKQYLLFLGDFKGNTLPDFKLLLLEKGYASLKHMDIAPENYRQAQDRAKASKLGIWKPTPIPTPPPSTSTPPQPIQTPQPSKPFFSIGEFLQGWDWGKTAKAVASFLVLLVGLYGGAATIQGIRTWLKRHRVPLILVGRPSTGKSWLWTRLLHPDVSESELLKIQRNAIIQKEEANAVKTMGRYEITPIYIDTPGMKPGQQIDALFKGQKSYGWINRLFKPIKSVLIIVLATTPDSTVSFDSTDEEKIDHSYIDQQLGHIDLALAILTSEHFPQQQMVIVCIAKFDLFSKSPPNTDNASREAELRLTGFFQKHIDILKQTCDEQKVQAISICCSARRQDWGTDKILGYIERAVFPRK